MPFELPPLPFNEKALEPHISAETIRYHYGKHHQGYINKLNTLIDNTEFAKLSLPTIIMKADGLLFNNAAQVWNHSFYWFCLKPGGPSKLPAELAKAIDERFGSLDKFEAAFKAKALSNFGSGWTWLVQGQNGNLDIVNTSNASTPMTSGQTALLTCDVWEHAYYIDARNDRGSYVDKFIELINWDFVARCFTGKYNEEEINALL